MCSVTLGLKLSVNAEICGGRWARELGFGELVICKTCLLDYINNLTVLRIIAPMMIDGVFGPLDTHSFLHATAAFPHLGQHE